MLGEGRTINVSGYACYIEYVENCYVNGNARKKNDDDPAARMTDELKGESSRFLTNAGYFNFSRSL